MWFLCLHSSSLGSCQLSPHAGAPRCLTPSPLLTPPSQPPPLGHSTAPAALPVFAAVCSQHQQLYLFTCSSVLCLYRPREDSTSLRFKHREGKELLGDCREAPEANLSPFIPVSSPLLHHLGSTQHQKNKACGSCSTKLL